MRSGITATQKQRTYHRGILFLFQVNHVDAAKLDVPLVPAEARRLWNTNTRFRKRDRIMAWDATP
jgi:hypothetical protein